tara:strand:- start:3248 stop:3370 length:123 start_codon:yes stop_codon:yes gene_type:complete
MKANSHLIFEWSIGHEVDLLDLAKIPKRTVGVGSLTSDLA